MAEALAVAGGVAGEHDQALLRMRLIVDRPEPEPELGPDPHAHLRAELEVVA